MALDFTDIFVKGWTLRPPVYDFLQMNFHCFQKKCRYRLNNFDQRDARLSKSFWAVSLSSDQASEENKTLELKSDLER